MWRSGDGRKSRRDAAVGRSPAGQGIEQKAKPLACHLGREPDQLKHLLLHGGVDASVLITLIDRDMPSYFRSLEHLLRYCARPPFALERLSVSRGPDGRIARVRYVLPRHKAANWVGLGRGRKSTRPGANGVVELSPFEFLDRLVDLVPPPRKHRDREHGVFAPNHKLRRAVTALAIGNVGKQRDAARPAGIRPAGSPRKAAATLMQSPARTTPPGSPGRNSWPG